MQNDIVLSCEKLSFQQQILFEDFNLNFKQRHWHSILGASGVGKSTVLKLLAGLLESAQNINFITQNVPNIAYMAQTDCLMPWLTALENVMVGFKLRGELSKEVKIKAIDILAQVGLVKETHKLPDALSGGQKQRVALARTLLEDKPLVLMDEPFSALDAVTRIKLQNLAAKLLKDKTVILVTHDPLEAVRLGQFIYVLAHNPVKIVKTIEQANINIPQPTSSKAVIALQAEVLEVLLEHAE